MPRQSRAALLESTPGGTHEPVSCLSEAAAARLNEISLRTLSLVDPDCDDLCLRHRRRLDRDIHRIAGTARCCPNLAFIGL